VWGGDGALGDESSKLAWSVNARELTAPVFLTHQQAVDALRLSREVGIEGANQDAGVSGRQLVQPDEVPAIERQQHTPLGSREGQDLLVRYRAASVAGLTAGQDIVTKPPQSFRHWQGEVLVGVEVCHPLCRLVLGNLRVDLVAVRALVRPGVD